MNDEAISINAAFTPRPLLQSLNLHTISFPQTRGQKCTHVRNSWLATRSSPPTRVSGSFRPLSYHRGQVASASPTSSDVWPRAASVAPHLHGALPTLLPKGLHWTWMTTQTVACYSREGFEVSRAGWFRPLLREPWCPSRGTPSRDQRNEHGFPRRNLIVNREDWSPQGWK